MALQFKDGYITSVVGRRLGLQTMTSGQSGSTTYAGGDSSPSPEFLIGPDGFRGAVTTTPTTSQKLPAFGISYLTTEVTGATTETVYILDPPIAGVRKTLIFATTNTGTNSIHVQCNAGTAGTVAFMSTAGSTMVVFNSTAGRAVTVELLGINSTQWAMTPFLSTSVIGQTTVIA